MKEKESINDLPAVRVTSDLQVANYNKLILDARTVRDEYIGFIGTAKDCRDIKRKFNAVRRKWNDLRKDKARPYRKQLKSFKSQIDALRNILGQVTDAMNKQLKIYKKQRLQKMIDDDLKPSMKQICKSRGIKELPIPDEALKLSMSKKKRLSFMAGVADKAENVQRLKAARSIGGKAVDTDTGEVVGLSKCLEFKGSQEQLNALLLFAKKQGIILQDK